MCEFHICIIGWCVLNKCVFLFVVCISVSYICISYLIVMYFSFKLVGSGQVCICIFVSYICIAYLLYLYLKLVGSRQAYSFRIFAICISYFFFGILSWWVLGRCERQTAGLCGDPHCPPYTSPIQVPQENIFMKSIRNILSHQ